MKRDISFSLIYRDMFQSSGKYQPRVDQLEKIAPVIAEMGCFSRIETNGGAFEQVQLLYGENPNVAVPRWTKTFNKAGIETHMLERALNGIRMYPVPSDIRKLMYKVKKSQGVDIARSFCGLNDIRNLQGSIEGAKEAGMTSQVALSITHSPIHTVDYYSAIVDEAVELGCDEICLKDMAGVGRPSILGQLVQAIKKRHPKILVQYHGHVGPGFSVASALEVARAGADVLDVATEPLSWGMVHPDVLAIQEMLKADGFIVPEINKKAYMEAMNLTQEFLDDFLGMFINPRNRQMTSLLIASGLPGGMMGSLMADLPGVVAFINSVSKKPKNESQVFVEMLEEVEHIWPLMGYPPLVTPFSQYVKNTALMNLKFLAEGNKRFHQLDADTKNMLLGRSGKLPGKLSDNVLQALEGEEFFKQNPQAYADEKADKDKSPNLEMARKEMEENGWKIDDAELFELAMHPQQYRKYKDGSAKEEFIQTIEQKRMQQSEPATGVSHKPSSLNELPDDIIAEIAHKFRLSLDELDEETEEGDINKLSWMFQKRNPVQKYHSENGDVAINMLKMDCWEFMINAQPYQAIIGDRSFNKSGQMLLRMRINDKDIKVVFEGDEIADINKM